MSPTQICSVRNVPVRSVTSTVRAGCSIVAGNSPCGAPVPWVPPGDSPAWKTQAPEETGRVGRTPCRARRPPRRGMHDGRDTQGRALLRCLNEKSIVDRDFSSIHRKPGALTSRRPVRVDVTAFAGCAGIDAVDVAVARVRQGFGVANVSGRGHGLIMRALAAATCRCTNVMKRF